MRKCKRTKASVSTDSCGRQDVNRSIEMSRWILKPIGNWPDRSQVSWVEKCPFLIINVVCYIFLLFPLIPCVLFMIYELENIYDKLRLTGPLSFRIMAVIKYYLLIVHGDDIWKCIEYIEMDWKNVNHADDRSVMIEYANYGRRLVKVSTFFMYFGAALYYLAIPIKIGKVRTQDDNVTFIPLFFPVSSHMIDARQSPANEIFFSVQCLSGFLAHNIAAGACSLAAIFSMHACGQMELLMSWLEHLVGGREDLSKDVDGRIAGIVKHHVRISNFLSLTEKILQQISLVEVFGCTLNMCLLGYYTIMEWDPTNPTVLVTYVSLLLSFVFNIFIFCYIGELVAEKCLKVGEMSYMTEWYRLPGKKGLAVILMIAMSSSPVKLTAGNIIDLSLTSFSDVVKTSVTYLNMLRTMTS